MKSYRDPSSEGPLTHLLVYLGIALVTIIAFSGYWIGAPFR